jgi:lipoate-protein ligase A
VTDGLRVIDTGVADARWNVAVTAALLELHAEGRIPDTLRLHRYRRCVLVGASQPVDDALGAAGAEIVRRVTGGGAVAMTPGVLAWDLVVGRELRRERLCRALTDVLGRFGVAAAFRPPGDIVADSHKLAGLAGAFEGPTRLHQGCLLVDCDPTELAGRFCWPTLPVATLAELVEPVPSLPEVAEAIAAAFAAAIGLPLRREALRRLELERAGMILADAAT